MTLLDLSCDSCSFRVYFYILNKRIQLTCEKVQSGECRFFLALLMSLTNFNAAFDSLVAVKKFPGRYFQGRLSLLPLGRPQWKAPLVTKRLSRLTQLIIVVSWITIQVHWTICYLLMKFNCPSIDAVVNFENFFNRVESFFILGMSCMHKNPCFYTEPSKRDTKTCQLPWWTHRAPHAKTRVIRVFELDCIMNSPISFGHNHWLVT